ncbi:PREDICTED: uncharacterized protein LOC104706241 [Camelina sativa]|uniref:Uncharacterized protein LOC104706241 n=1 Tax=Camelina sativa TaxID=90675 RepID=A0ABM0T4D8_CAMSA|nr:PREDICTED: uncharacterized protein LOC104706241 [Camelina sativa]
MAMELELDDDVFFADISKQISLLITDEDEQLNPVSLSSSSPSLSFQGLFRGGYQTAPYMYHQEQSKGTGVFIPKSSHPRRRPHHHQKQGKYSSFNAKQQHSLQQNRQEYYQQNHENARSTLTTHNNNNKRNMNTSVHAHIPRRTYGDASSIYT